MPINQSLPGNTVASIEIELRRGDVVVDVSPDDQINLRADFSSGATEVDLRVEQVGNALRILQAPADVNREGFGFLNDLGLGALVGQIGRIDLRLGIPRGSRNMLATVGLGAVAIAEWNGSLQIRSGKGDLTVGSCDGQTDVKTGMGAVRIDRVAGECSINDGLGDVTIGAGNGRLKINAGKGSIRIQDANLVLDARSGMGDVALERVGGQATIHSGFGEIIVDDARDLLLDATSGNGAIRVGGDFRSVKAKSGMGPIAAQPRRLTGPAELTTGNGDVDLALTTDQALRIDASTGRGRIDSEVPLVQVGQTGPEGYFSKRVVGTIGTGDIQATVRVRSGNGNVRLRRLGAVSTVPTTPPPPSQTTPVAVAPATNGGGDAATEAPRETVIHSDAPIASGRSRLEILQSLSRGDITVEEAERQLTQT